MKQSLKKIAFGFLALTFPCLGWGVKPWATWTDFTGLTDSKAPDIFSTQNSINGGNFTFHLGSGVVQDDGSIVTTGGSGTIAPYIKFNQTINVGYDYNDITVVMTVEIPSTVSNVKPLWTVGNGSAGIGLTVKEVSNDGVTFGGSWGTTADWSGATANRSIRSSIKPANVVTLVTKTNSYLNLHTLTNGTLEEVGTISGLRGNSINADRITFGNMYNNGEGTIHYRILNVAVFHGASATAANMTLVTTKPTEYDRTLESSEETWSTPEQWDGGSAPEGVSITANLEVTAENGSTLNLDTSVELFALEVSGSEKLTITGSGLNGSGLNSLKTTINADTDVSGITADLGNVTIAEGATLTIGPNTTYSSISGAGTLVCENCVPTNFDLNTTGATVRFVGTAESETNSIKASNGTVEIAQDAQISVPHLRFLNRNNTGDRVTLNVAGTLNVTTTCTAPYDQNTAGGGHSANKGILFGHYHGKGTYNITGNLIGENTYLMTVYTAEAQTININGGSLRVRALVAGNANSSTINLTNNGTLSLATWPSTSAIAQNYGHGTVTTYNCTEEQTKGWTNPQAVSFTDKTNGTTLDPASETIAFIGTITDGAEGGGAKIIVNDSGDGTGIVNLSGATLPDTLQYVVNAGTLILPAGKEGNATVAEGATLKLVLSAEQQAGIYRTTATKAEGGTIVFVAAGALDTPLGTEDGVSKDGCTYVTTENPIWTPTSAASEWGTEGCWNLETIPTEGTLIVNAMDADFNATLDVPTGYAFTSIKVYGNDTHVTKVTFTNAPTAITSVVIAGRVALPHTLISSNGVTRTIANGATVISIVDQDGSWDTNVTNLYNFGKMGSGTLTLTPQLSGSHPMHIYEGTIKVGGSANGNYTATITIDDGATLAIDSSHYNPVCGSGTIVNNGTITYTGSNEGHLPAVISGTGKLVVNGGTLTLGQANTYTGGTEIAAGATVTITNTNALGTGTITGAGTLACANNIVPANKNGLTTGTAAEGETPASGWTGTVVFNNLAGNTSGTPMWGLNPTNYGNAASTIEFAGACSGWLTTQGTCVSSICVSGTLTFNNGASTNGGYTFSGPLSGNGIIATSGGVTDVIQFTGNTSGFDGTITVEGGHCIVFGEQADDDQHSGQLLIQSGKTANIAANKTWTAENGIEVSGTLGGAGTIGSAATFYDGAILNVGATPLTVDSLNVNGEVTVNLPESAEIATTPVLQLATATAEGKVYVGSGIKVQVNGAPQEGTYYFVAEPGTEQVYLKTGTIATTEPQVVTTAPDRVLIDATQFGYGTHTIFSSESTIDWSTMEVIGIDPEDVVIDTENNTWGFQVKTLVIYPVGDSITHGRTRYFNDNNTDTPGGYRLPLYERLKAAGYVTKYVGNHTANSSTLLTADGQTYHSGHSAWHVENSSNSGRSVYAHVAGWAPTVRNCADGRDPDVILLLLGVNDLNNNEAAATTAAQMQALIWRLAGIGEGTEAVLYPKARIVLAKVLDSTYAEKYEALSTVIGEYNTALETFVSGLTDEKGGDRISLIDLNMPLDAENGYTYFRYDNLHPAAEGYTQMARNWFAELERLYPPTNAEEAPVVSVKESHLNTTITLAFDKAMDKTSVEMVANYTLAIGSVSEVKLLDDLRSAVVTVEGATAGVANTLTVKELTDTQGLTSEEVALEVTMGPAATPTYVVPQYAGQRKHTNYTNPLDRVAEWSFFDIEAMTAEGGYPAQFGAARDAERNWTLSVLRNGSTTMEDVTTETPPTVHDDGSISLNGGALYVTTNPEYRPQAGNGRWTVIVETIGEVPANTVLATVKTRENDVLFQDLYGLRTGENNTVVTVDAAVDADQSRYPDVASNAVMMNDAGLNQFVLSFGGAGYKAWVNSVPVTFTAAVNQNYSGTVLGFTIGGTNYNGTYPGSNARIKRIVICQGTAADAVLQEVIRVGESEGMYTSLDAALQNLMVNPASGLRLDYAEAAKTFTIDTDDTIGNITTTGASGTLDATEKVTVGDLTIAADQTITLGNKMTITNLLGDGTLAGSGTLLCDGALPTKTTGLSNAAWTGTVWLKDVTHGSALTLNNYGNADSTVCFENVIGGYFDPPTGSVTFLPNIQLEGNGWKSQDGNTGVTLTFSGDLTGSGTLDMTATKPSDGHLYMFTGETSDFTGEIKVGGKQIVAFGEISASFVNSGSKPWHLEGETTDLSGKIVIANSVIIPDEKTWTATNGVRVLGTGTLSGVGTIDSALTFDNGATIDASTNALTVTGTITIDDGATLNVLVEDNPTVGDVVLTCASAENATAIVGKLTNDTYAFTAEGSAIKVAAVCTAGETSYASIQQAVDAQATNITVFVETQEVVKLSASTPVSIGGTFTGTVTDAYGNVLKAEADGTTYTIPAEGDYIAQVGDKKCLTIEYAIEVGAAEVSQAITLLADVAIAGNHTIANVITGGYSISIASGNVTLSATNTYTGGTEIATGARVILGGPSAIPEGSLTGAGTVEINAKANLPSHAIVSADWTGTVLLSSSINGVTDLTLSRLTNEKSVIEIPKGVTIEGYLASEVASSLGGLVLNGTIDLTNGYGAGAYTFNGALTGSGEFKVRYTGNQSNGGPNDIVTFVGEVSNFFGTITAQNRRCVTIGSDANRGEGCIVVNGTINIASGKTWTATNGVRVLGTGTLSGVGTIGSALTFNNGATLDASAGALTVNSVTWNDSVVIQVPKEGDWANGVEVLNTATTLPTNYVIMQGENVASTLMLVARTDDGIYAVEPTVPEISVGEGDAVETITVAPSNLAAIKAAAAAAKVQTVSSIVGAELVPAAGETPAKVVDVAGLALFEDIPVVVAGGTATIKYAFGITSVAVNSDKKVVVTAKVSMLDKSEGPTFVDGVTVALYSGDTLIGTATANAGDSEVTIISEEAILTDDLGTNPSLTKPLTVKAVKQSE